MIIIRLQNSRRIKECKDISYQDYVGITSSAYIHPNDLGKLCIIESTEDGYVCLGQYSTEAKALKVLDMIQEKLETMARGQIITVFQMPQDEEVIV
mgnify:CR=1 FL=1